MMCPIFLLLILGEMSFTIPLQKGFEFYCLFSRQSDLYFPGDIL